MDSSKYINEVTTQLANTTVYRQLKKDPTPIFKKEIDNIIDEAFMMGVLSSETKKH